MADEENEEPKKKSGLVKILIFVFAGILLIAVGLGVGYFMFGSQQPDPSEEIDAIIEKTKKRLRQKSKPLWNKHKMRLKKWQRKSRKRKPL